MQARPLTRRIALALIAGAALLPSLSVAQEYPSRPIRIIVPQPPGGGFDLVGRVVGQQLQNQIGQSVVVENRTGAGTLVGTEAAAKSPADGYTLLVGGFSNIAANVGLYKSLPYDPIADFTPVGMVSTVGYALVSRKDLPLNSLKEIIDFARANPGKLTYASGGVGTGQHIAGAALGQITNTNLVHVPYRGASAAYQDLLSGRVDLFFDNAGTAKAYIDSQQVKAFALSTAERSPSLPGLPTVNETGVGKLEAEAWFGIFGRVGTPAPVLNRLRSEMAKVIQGSEVIGRMEKAGLRILRMTPAESDAFVRSEVAKWSALIRQAGISAE